MKELQYKYIMYTEWNDSYKWEDGDNRVVTDTNLIYDVWSIHPVGALLPPPANITLKVQK